MAWQGVPFLFDNNTSANDLIIALKSLPKIVVDSPPDYTNLGITALVSLAAGIIPAMIALWTFKQNTRNAKDERQKQQDFLRDERENQQRFLEEDRAKQQESYEQDRLTQIEVAKRSFDIQVLSGNRQDWINNLREVASEYSSSAASEIDLCITYQIQKKLVDGLIVKVNEGSLYSKSDEFKDIFSKEKIELFTRQERLGTVSGRVKFLEAKIKMMLNPKEKEYSKIVSLFTAIKSSKVALVNADDVLVVQRQEYANVINSINEIISLMQGIFKSEWERVKSGI